MHESTKIRLSLDLLLQIKALRVESRTQEGDSFCPKRLNSAPAPPWERARSQLNSALNSAKDVTPCPADPYFLRNTF
jgi:hypothetical protein